MRGVLLCLCAAGCAASASARGQTPSDRLAALPTDQARLSRRVDDLENRLMLLEDKLDTRRVAEEAQGRTPTLPVVMLAPAPAPSADPGDAGADEDAEASSRPVLRLHGSARPTAAKEGGPEIHAVNERLPIAPLPPRPAAAPSPPPARSSDDPLRLYRADHDLVSAGHYAEARAGFEAFLKDHPDHDYADNAAYWIGECYYAERDWPHALVAFRRVLDSYPKGNKAPDALLKLGFTYLAAGDRASAVQVLEQVTRTYARAEVATLARAKLEEIHD
jgi:tol-pal system protein YbgF